jgi:hypothetical protein
LIRVVPALAIAAALVAGIFLLHWREVELGEFSLRVGPHVVQACNPQRCEDGEPLGLTVASVHEQLDGPAYVTAMALAYWTGVAAIAAQVGIAVLVLLGARDRWLPRIVATVAGVAAAIAAAAIAYSGSRGPGLWLTLAAALAGAIIPLVGKRAVA